MTRDAAGGSRLDVVLLGPPGAGKGTQAVRLAQARGLRHLSTGDLLRQAIATGSELGRQVQAIVEGGQLVPDDVVVGLVDERLGGRSDGGVLLDGFPRTVRQGELLGALFVARGLAPPLVVEMVVPDAEVVRRLAARRTCAACGPRPPGETTCGGCGRTLTVRADDDERVVRQRLAVYRDQTVPLSAWYRERGRLRTVDASGTPEEVAARIASAAMERTEGDDAGAG